MIANRYELVFFVVVVVVDVIVLNDANIMKLDSGDGCTRL